MLLPLRHPQFWALVRSRSKDGGNVVTRDAYVKLGVRLFKALLPSVKPADAVEQMERDWVRDSTAGDDDGGGVVPDWIGPAGFFNVMFELADVWTTGVSEVEYVYFLEALLWTITEGQPPILDTQGVCVCCMRNVCLCV